MFILCCLQSAFCHFSGAQFLSCNFYWMHYRESIYSMNLNFYNSYHLLFYLFFFLVIYYYKETFLIVLESAHIYLITKKNLFIELLSVS